MMHVKRLKAGGVLSDGKNIYIVYRAERKSPDYSLPKGHCEEGETFEETAYREVLEETGVKGKIIGEIDTVCYSWESETEINDCEVHYFAMEVDTVGEKTAQDDVSCVLKYPIEGIEEHLSFESDKEIIKKWKNIYYK